jgi:hypothetical protein
MVVRWREKDAVFVVNESAISNSERAVETKRLPPRGAARLAKIESPPQSASGSACRAPNALSADSAKRVSLSAHRDEATRLP